MRERAARTRAEAALHANEQALDKMAHDMRNQFNALASAVEVLKSADTKSSLGMRALAIIARQTRQLSELLAALPAPSAGSHSLAEGVAVDPDDGAA